MTKGTSDIQNSKIQVRPQQARRDLMHCVNQVMMVHPHDGDHKKAESVADKDGSDFRAAPARLAAKARAIRAP